MANLGKETDPLINSSGIQPFGPPNFGRKEPSKKNIFGKEIEMDCSKEKCWKVFKSFLPIMTWLPKYRLNWLQCDLIAGLTVGLTVIPQGLAYAQIAGLPVQYGLYSAFMGGFIYCIFGTSKDVTLGPTAIMSLLVHTYGNQDPLQAVLLTFLAGFIQLGMGIFRLGFIMRYISIPVISGFTSAGAITIALGQLKHIFGVRTKSESFFPQMIETFKELSHANVWDVVMGLSCIACLTLLRYVREWIEPESPEDTLCQKLSKKFIWLVSIGRNAIVVVSAGLVAYTIHTQDVKNCKVKDCLTLTGEIEEGLPVFALPDFEEHSGNKTVTTRDLVSDIGIGLLVVPLMGLLESIAIGRAFARKNGYNIDTNQEMIAIGASNVMSSFVSSYCITGSFSRTAINAQSNVKSPAGGIFTGVLVILSLAFLTPSFYFVPKSALAAVIISAVIYMVDLQTVVALWKVKKIDLLPLVVTFLVCFWQIPYGILAGIAVSLVILLYPVTFPSTSYKVTPVDEEDGVMLAVTPESGLYYPAAEYLTDKIRSKIFSIIHSENVSKVIIDAKNFSSLDYTSILGLVELGEELNRQKISLTLACLDLSLIEQLQKADVLSLIKYTGSISDEDA